MRGGTFKEGTTDTETDFSGASTCEARQRVNKMCCGGSQISPKLCLLEIN